MSNLSKRLNSLAYFVEKEDRVVDVGCDHGYLSIYLTEKQLCKNVIATDINPIALQGAKENIKKKNLSIETRVSDGLLNVPLEKCDTLVISGMGTNTILHILDESKLKRIKKIILQSNNEHAFLRKSLNNLGFYLEEERIVYDKGKWYVTMLFLRSDKKNKEREILYGYLNHPLYNQVMLENLKKIVKRIPFTSIKAKIKAQKNYRKLKRAMR